MSNNKSNPSGNKLESDMRGILASNIGKIVIFGSVVLGVVGIGFSIMVSFKNPDKGIQILQYVFGALLPLWGTWIGTVLAFYFSKENFESANQNVRELVNKMTSDDKLGQMKVSEGMLRYEDFVKTSLIVDSKEKLDDIKVDDMINTLGKYGRQRLPILIGKQAVHVFHKSGLLEFRFDEKSKATTTYKEMKTSGNQWIKDILSKSVLYLSQDDSLLTAKRLMESEAACNDVMVTTSGSAGGDVIGWVTDKMIAEKSKI